MKKNILGLIALFLLVGGVIFARTNQDQQVPADKHDRIAWLKYNDALDRRAQMSKLSAFSDRKAGTHNGNRVRTLFYNYGSIGRPNTEPSMEWPIGSGRGYAFEFGVIAGAKIKTRGGDDDIIVSDGLTVAGVRYSSDFDNDPGDWQPLPGFHDPFQASIAMSDAVDDDRDGKPDSWPSKWYDPNFSDYMWPGEYGQGITTADQESYYVMDDFYIKSHNTYWPQQGWSDSLRGDEFYPGFPIDTVRGGLGLQVESRGYQWIATRAQNVIFFVYELTNVGTDTLNNIYFGMYGDPHVGGSSDYNDDDAYFDTYIDIVYGWDDNAIGDPVFGTTIPGFFGYKFLESPGEPRNNIDDDADGMIDESMQDGIDNDGDWETFTDWNLNGSWDTGEPINDDLGRDGVGPDDPQYIRPDADGSEANGFPDPGEPNFDEKDLDEADQIGLTGFVVEPYSNSTVSEDYYYSSRLTAPIDTSAFQQNSDNIFMYSSGPIKMAPNDVRRFSISMLYGYNTNAATGEYVYEDPHNIRDLYATAAIMQEIYDAGYRFVKPPNKPRLTAVAGNNQVTLYWDESAEHSRDPLYGNDFEGYAIYRATDFGFNEALDITDAYGSPYLWKPIAKYDLKNGISGPHPIEQIKNSGLHYDMGANTGLVHSFVDRNLINGQRYFYAICAYDSGSVGDTIPPTETAKTIQEDFAGNVVLDVNTAMVTPQAPSIGFIAPEINDVTDTSGISGTGEVEFVIIDPTRIPSDRNLELRFVDSGMDLVDNDGDWSSYADLDQIRNNGAYVDMIIPASSDTISYSSTITEVITLEATAGKVFEHNGFSWRIKTWEEGPTVITDTVFIYPDAFVILPTLDVWDPAIDGSVNDDVGSDGCSDEYEDGSGGCLDLAAAAPGDDPNGDNWHPQTNPTGTEANGRPDTGEPDLDMKDFQELIRSTQSFNVADVTDPLNEFDILDDQFGLHGEDFNQISNGLQVFVHNDTLMLDDARIGWTSGDCVWRPAARVYNGGTKGVPIPLDYRLEFYNTVVDTSLRLGSWTRTQSRMTYKVMDKHTGVRRNVIVTSPSDSTLVATSKITPFAYTNEAQVGTVIGADLMPTWEFTFQTAVSRILSLMPTADGVLVGTSLTGVVMYNQDSKAWKFLSNASTGGGLLSDGAIKDIFYHEGHYWIATSKGPSIYDGNIWKHNHPLELQFDLWEDDKDATLEEPQATKDYAACIAFGSDEEGYLWIATDVHGIIRVNTRGTYLTGYDDEITYYQGPDTLSSNLAHLTDTEINDMLVDGHMVWLATNKGVVSFDYVSSVWTHYPKNNVNGLLNDDIFAITKLPASLGGHLVFATAKGVAILVDDAFVVYTKSNSALPNDKVLSVYYRSDSELYAGTAAGFGVLDLSGVGADFSGTLESEGFTASWGDSTIYTDKNISTITFSGDYGYFGTELGLEQRLSKYEWNTFGPQPGDVLEIYTRKEFSSLDVFEYETSAALEDAQKLVDHLDRVSVVPNPYVAAAVWEQKPYLQSGRGERKIYFINLPSECTIRIYTISGELVRKLEHSESVFNGAEAWDLLNLDNLEVAFGVYIYHVETANAETIGKFAVIK